jgi:hypothetical protein
VLKLVAPSDPAQLTGDLRNAAFFAYADNYLADVKFGIIVDVEPSLAIRRSEVGASQTMIERTENTVGNKLDWLVADTAYGAAEKISTSWSMCRGSPHIPVVEKSKRDDDTFNRDDFIYDEGCDHYVCASGKILPRSSGARGPRGMMLSLISRPPPTAGTAPLKSKCCPNLPSRKITRQVHEAARDVARAIAKKPAYSDPTRLQEGRDSVCTPQADLRLGRLRLCGPAGARFEFTLAAVAQNLRRLAKLAINPPETAAPRVA